MEGQAGAWLGRTTRPYARLAGAAIVGLVAAAGMVLGVAAQASGTTGTTYVYFDQNEEEDFVSTSTSAVQQFVKPWDAEAQLCIFPDGSGRFTTTYNPTAPSQTETVARFRPHMQPPVGEVVWDARGNWTGQTLYVPGPYRLTPASPDYPPGVVGPDVGGDIPPDHDGGFHNNASYTGCTFDGRGNLFAVDLATSQGNYPPNDDGRLIEWFGPKYDPNAACIVYGPTGGGVGPHHVDGHGGLQQPGMMAADSSGNIYLSVDEAGTADTPRGRILEFPEAELPAQPAQCANARGDYHVTQPRVFIEAWEYGLPFPQGIARDPVCGCWAVDSIIGSPAVEWFDDNGVPVPTKHLPIPGDYATQFSPSGMAFDPQGDLFVVDLHVTVHGASSGGFSAGPQAFAGRLLKFSFAGPIPLPPVTIARGEFDPQSVTTCTPSERVCPAPPGLPTSTSPVGAVGAEATASATPAIGRSGAATVLADTSATGAGGGAPALAVGALVAGVVARAGRRRRARSGDGPAPPPLI